MPNLTHTACFRITDTQFRDFQRLLDDLPGAEAGSLYREIFSLGLASLFGHPAVPNGRQDASEGRTK